MEWRLLLAGSVQAMAAIAYLVVFVVLARRSVAREARAAHMAFMAWWAAFGLYNLAQAWAHFWVAATPVGPDAAMALRFEQIALLALGGWGLAFYVVFLYTGRRWTWAPIAAVYFGLAVWFYVFTVQHEPVGITDTGWLAETEYGRPVDTQQYRTLVTLFGAPLLIGTALYLSLLRTLEDRTARYRVALVGTSLLAWIGSGLAARFTSNEAVIYFTLVGMGLVSATAVLLAYLPPAPIRRRLDASQERQVHS